jgi:two-component system CheB/CheR fusion protein
VLHLAPKHVSHVAEILQRVTSMPVHQVNSTMPVEKNHVYVIAPGKQLEMTDGCVRCGDIGLSDRPVLAIDHFFRTLADAHDHRAVGIVLSGSGSDGAAV